MRFVLVGVVTVLTGAVGVARGVSRYTIQSLGPFTDQASEINDAGTVVGWDYVFNQGWVWSNGTKTILSALNGTTTTPTFASGINNLGDVVGSSYKLNSSTLAVWSHSAPSTPTDLLSSDIFGTGQALCINDAGLVGGQYQPNYSTTSPFVWDSTHGIQQLSTGTGGVYRINQNGVAVGNANEATDDAFSFTWTQAKGVVPLASGTFTDIRPTSINDAGYVVGYGEAAHEHALEWDPDGTLHDLGTFNSGTFEPKDINNAGQIVGIANTLGGYGSNYPFIIDQGQLYDIRTLIDGGGGWTIQNLWANNNTGQIVGSGQFADQGTMGFVLTPVPEPIGLVWLGALVALARRRSKKTKTEM